MGPRGHSWCHKLARAVFFTGTQLPRCKFKEQSCSHPGLRFPGGLHGKCEVRKWQARDGDNHHGMVGKTTKLGWKELRRGRKGLRDREKVEVDEVEGPL